MKKLLLLLVVVLVFNNTMAQMTWMTAYKGSILITQDPKEKGPTTGPFKKTN